MVDKMKIKPPFIAISYLLIAFGLDLLFPTQKIIIFPNNLIGVLIIVGGISLIVSAAILFKKEGTPKNPFKKPTVMISSGPYKFTRNPMYVGVTLVSLGISVLIGTYIMFLAPLAFFLTINFTFIPREEKIMENLFGQKYLDYKKKVRRWL